MSRARWYLADLVVAVSIEGLAHTVVNVSSVLLSAESHDTAYERALEHGRNQQLSTFRSEAGKEIRYRFLGIAELNRVSDDLFDGAEVRWQELQARSVEEAAALTRSKDDLAIFRNSGEAPSAARAPVPRKP